MANTTVNPERGIEDIACTASTIQKCPNCGAQSRLDTEAGLGAVEMKSGMPFIRCDCGNISPMAIESI